MKVFLAENGRVLFIFLGMAFSFYASIVFNVLLFILGLILLSAGLFYND